jgi:tetratricopeptide (TPR) repeat protein
MSGAAPTPARLLGREAELGVLRAELDAALRGEGGLVFLAGEAGIGKTRTATALCAEARERGARVAWGRCHEGGGAPVYWPFVQALGSLAGAGDAARRIAALRLALREPGETAGTGTAAGARFELFADVLDALAAAAREQPLVLALDDLHQADVGSLRLLEFLGRELGSLPLLALGTLREGAERPGDEAGALLASVVRLGRRIALGGLPRAALAQLLEDRLGRAPEPGVVEQVARISDGNPYFVIELAHVIAAAPAGAGERAPAVPPGAQELLRRRLAPLPAASLELLRAASVLGREFDLGLLARVVDEPVERALAALGPALAADLVRELPGALRRFSFTHALMREALYADLAPGDRAARHGRVAEALEAAGAGDDDRLAALAHHGYEAAQAGDPSKAVRYGLAAGERALRLLAFEEAARHFERALAAEALAPDQRARARILLGLAEALSGSGDQQRSDARFGEALAAARRSGGADFADAALRYATARPEFGVLDLATNALLEEGLAGLPEEPTPLRARLLARLAAGLNLEPGSEARCRRLSDEAVRIARTLRDPHTLGFALSRRLLALLGPDHLEERAATTDEVLRFGPRSRAGELEALVVRAGDLAERADRVGLDHAFAVFEEKARASRLPFFACQVSAGRTAMALLEGRFEEAEALARETLAQGQRAQIPRTALLNFGQHLFMLRGWQGRLAEVAPLLETGVAETAVVPAWRCGLATFYSISGRDSEARRELDALAAHDFTDLPRDTTWLTSMSLLSRVCARLPDVRRAEQLYELMRPFAGRIAVGRPLVVLVAAIDERLGALATALGRFEAAEAHFAAALALAERMRALPWQAEVRHERARMLLARSAQGDREHALRLLDEAEAIARPIGMGLLLGWIEACRQAARVGAARAVGAEEARRAGGESRRGNVVTLLPRGATPGAPAPAAPPGAGAPRVAPVRAGSLRREGEVWTCVFEGRTTRVRHMLGLGHLALLLRQPEREIHASDLVAAAYAGQRATRAGVGAAASDAGPHLDARARASYEERLREAREELEEARRHADRGRSERLAEEIEFLAAELSRGVGLGGRARRAGSDAERARVSVTRAIKYAIEKLGEHDAALAEHLRRSVRTGAFCAYLPSPRDRVSWSL